MANAASGRVSPTRWRFALLPVWNGVLQWTVLRGGLSERLRA